MTGVRPMDEAERHKARDGLGRALVDALRAGAVDQFDQNREGAYPEWAEVLEPGREVYRRAAETLYTLGAEELRRLTLSVLGELRAYARQPLLVRAAETTQRARTRAQAVLETLDAIERALTGGELPSAPGVTAAQDVRHHLERDAGGGVA